MNLQEQIKRMQQLMGIIVENEETKTNFAPHGVIFFGDNKVLVGDMHGESHELSNDLVDKIVKIANQYGFWGEGTGIEHNKAILESPIYEKLDMKKHMGSWDAKVEVSKNETYVFLYALFSNPKENNRVGKLLNEVKEGETIFDLLARTIPSWSAEMGKYNLGSNDLKKFLIKCSEKGIDFLKLSQQEATEENLQDFIDKGESLQWPENWEEYPNKAGQIARKATKIRDEYLINAGPGVYFVGSGHLKDIMKMVGKEIGLTLIGGEKI